MMYLRVECLPNKTALNLSILEMSNSPCMDNEKSSGQVVGRPSTFTTDQQARGTINWARMGIGISIQIDMSTGIFKLHGTMASEKSKHHV